MRRAGGLRCLAFVLFGLLALGAPGVAPAWAQEAPAASRQLDVSKQVLTPAQDAEVQRLYGEGIEAAKSGNFEKARQLFEKAFRMKQHWKIAANLGRAESSLGKFAGAADHLEYFLREAGPNDISQEDRDKAQALLNEALLKSARIDVITDVQDADVLVDGKVVGRTPFYDGRVYVAPAEGKHEVTARKKGFKSSPPREEVNLAPGGKSSRRLEFELKEDASGGWKGDGDSGDSENSGAGGVGRQTGNAEYPTEPEPPWHAPVKYTAIGLTAVGLGVGIGFTVGALVNGDQIDKDEDSLASITTSGLSICGETSAVDLNKIECSELKKVYDRKAIFGNVAIVGYVIGGVGIVGIAAAALWSPKPSSKASNSAKRTEWHVVPVLSSSDAGVVLRGSF